MKVWCVVDDRGRWTGSALTLPEADVAANTPPGCTAVPGSPRDLLQTGAMQPPPLPADTAMVTHRWCPDTLTAVAEPTVRARNAARRAELVAQIQERERASARPLRELLIDQTDLDARKRLILVDQAIAELRAELRRVDEQTPPPG